MGLISGVLQAALPIFSELFLEYLRRQSSSALYHLQRKEEASEVLVGFAPAVSSTEQELFSPSSEASIQERTTVLQSAQGRIDEIAVDVIGKVQPTKAESHLPGVGNAHQDLEQLRNRQMDFSWLTNMCRLTATPSMISRLARAKQVAFVVPNFDVRLPRQVEITEADVKPVQEREKEQKKTWGIDYLKIPVLWEQGLTGAGVLIGHLDTGIDASHPDLIDKIEQFALFDPRGQRVEKCDPFDSDEHGTHTAGTIVGGTSSGVAIGVAPKAKLVSALVLMRGSGTVWQTIKGIEWAVSQRVRILNLSLGGSGYSSIYEYALARVAAMGVFPSCSVGNDGLAVTGSPGNLALACGVGAIGPDKKAADFSGGGSISWYNELGQLVEIHKPDVVAPGVAIHSSLPRRQWGHLNGTSMAAPHVSGVVALLSQARPSATLAQLLQALYATAVHPVAKEKRADSRYGKGIIDPVRALEQLTV